MSYVSKQDKTLEIVFTERQDSPRIDISTAQQKKEKVDTSINKKAKFEADRTLFADKDIFALNKNALYQTDFQSGGKKGTSSKTPKPNLDKDDMGDPNNLSTHDKTTERRPLELPGFSLSDGNGSTNSPYKTQMLMPPGVELGDIYSLNTNHSHYISFMNRIKNNVGPVWAASVLQAVLKELQQDNLPGVGRTFVTEIEVTMDDKGVILDIKPFRLSGLWSFDSALINAFKEAKNIPNPPEGMIDEDGYVRMQYRATIYWSPPPNKPIHFQYAK